jgi:inorganic triphosphatase YgiF
VPAEIELKLALDPVAIPHPTRLGRHPAIAAVKSGRAHSARVVSTYYDTSDFRLAREGIALRLRRDGRRWLQTVKGPPLAGSGAGLHGRDEHECRLPGPRLDPARLATTPWRKLLAKAQQRGDLVPQFTTDFLRQTIPLAFPDGTRSTLALDVGAIRARRLPGRRAPIAEIEIELVAGSAARLYELALALSDDWPLTVATANKAERGYALVRGEPDGWRLPVRAGAAEIGAKATAEAALRAIAQECLHQIAANAAGLVADSDPEWVHQMRIGTRRLRSCLALIAPVAPAERVDPLVAEIRWLAGILGAARDWDVFALETLPPLALGFAHDPAAVTGLKRLRRRVAAKRSAARAATREAVRSPRFQRLLLATGAFCATPRFGMRDDAGSNAPAQPFAAGLLARRQRKLARRAMALENGTAEERHAARIAAKKLRYAAEFFAPLFPGKRTRAYLKALGALQDALGHCNDAATAARLAAGLAGDADQVTVGAVRGWVAARAAALLPELARAWRRFAGTKRFWTRD